MVGESYCDRVAYAEHLIDKAVVLAEASKRAESVYVKAVFDRDYNALYARAVDIKREAREMLAKGGKEGAN